MLQLKNNDQTELNCKTMVEIFIIKLNYLKNENFYV